MCGLLRYTYKPWLMSEEKYFFTILLRSFGAVSAYGAETFIMVFVGCCSI